MLEERETQNHTPLGLIPPLKTIMPWRVSEVTPLADFRLHVTFQDGVQGIVCLQQRVASENAPVFKSLADKAVFDAVTVRYGAVTWDHGIDLAPDAMYDAIKASGVWVLC